MYDYNITVAYYAMALVVCICMCVCTRVHFHVDGWFALHMEQAEARQLLAGMSRCMFVCAPARGCWFAVALACLHC